MRELKVKQFESLCSDQYSLLKELSEFISRDDIVITHLDTNIMPTEKGILSKTTVLYHDINKITDEGADRLMSAILGYKFEHLKEGEKKEEENQKLA